jgi:hypothetical protein
MFSKFHVLSTISLWSLFFLSCNLTVGDSIFFKKIANRDNLKILILGNSITGAPAFLEDWKLGGGLAASTPEADYVHILFKYISETLHYEPQMITVSINAWEKNFPVFDLTEWDTLKNFKADLILFRIGDNIQGELAVKAYFWEKFDTLISFFLQNEEQVVLCTSSWYHNKTVDAIMKTVCEKRHISFIDISPLYSDQSNHASSERPIKDWGIGSHPGDKGMRAIADILWKNISSML